MPGSWPYLREPIKTYLTQNFSKHCTILDVGAGEGTYFNLLSDYFYKFDAVEIWEPYVEQYKLKEKYKNVYNINIIDFTFEWYDIIIMGDVLEHLSASDGIALLSKIFNKCTQLIVNVPFNLPQEEVFGNLYEKHLQPDLNHNIMSERYPMLKMLYVNEIPCQVPIEIGENLYHLCAYIKNETYN